MISIKQYLEQTEVRAAARPVDAGKRELKTLFPATVTAFRTALTEMGASGQEACPALGAELKLGLGALSAELSGAATAAEVAAADAGIRERLRGWGRAAALHYQKKTGEVREILLVMARTAESVGERDQRCAAQIHEVTARLKRIATLEDLTEIRASIEKSATELKSSIDRMTAEGKATLDHLQAKVTSYQTRLEEAEEVASRDGLTGLRSRLWVEGQLEQAIESSAPFCVSIIDINKFKQVNDEHGHLVGDELLKQFSTELRSVCRATDTIGRWGGDEFLLLLQCGLSEATAQIDRLREWVCGNYTLQGSGAAVKLRVEASIGLAEHVPGETLKELVDRADAAMYKEKAVSRAGTGGRKQ